MRWIGRWADRRPNPDGLYEGDYAGNPPDNEDSANIKSKFKDGMKPATWSSASASFHEVGQRGTAGVDQCFADALKVCFRIATGHLGRCRSTTDQPADLPGEYEHRHTMPPGPPCCYARTHYRSPSFHGIHCSPTGRVSAYAANRHPHAGRVARPHASTRRSARHPRCQWRRQIDAADGAGRARRTCARPGDAGRGPPSITVSPLTRAQHIGLLPQGDDGAYFGNVADFVALGRFPFGHLPGDLASQLATWN